MKKQTIEHLEIWNKLKSKEIKPEKKLKLTNKIVEIYYPLVNKISYKYADHINFKRQPDELSSFGVDGLYDAIKKFDIGKGVKFTSYASRKIRWFIIDNLRKEDNVPRSTRIKYKKVEEKQEELQQERGEKVEIDETLEILGLYKKKYKTIKKRRNRDRVINDNIPKVISNIDAFVGVDM